jgi:hypothetical protein
MFLFPVNGDALSVFYPVRADEDHERVALKIVDLVALGAPPQPRSGPDPTALQFPAPKAAFPFGFDDR